MQGGGGWWENQLKLKAATDDKKQIRALESAKVDMGIELMSKIEGVEKRIRLESLSIKSLDCVVNELEI